MEIIHNMVEHMVVPVISNKMRGPAGIVADMLEQQRVDALIVEVTCKASSIPLKNNTMTWWQPETPPSLSKLRHRSTDNYNGEPVHHPYQDFYRFLSVFRSILFEFMAAHSTGYQTATGMLASFH